MEKAIHCENENEDRLSDLPDNVLLHILSFLNTKYAVQTCILSTRWKNLWKHIPTLILHCLEFPTMENFTSSVSKILTLRDSTTSLHALDLDHTPYDGNIPSKLLKKILDYVSSHNFHLRQLGISVRGDSDLILHCVSSCHALTSLTLSVYPKGGNNERTLFPKSLKLPALTSLYLQNFAFCGDESSCVEPFFAFKMLNSLVIQKCEVRDARVLLVISSETLVNLSINNSPHEDTITDKIELSTPSRRAFSYRGNHAQKICEKGHSSISMLALRIFSSLPDKLEKKCPSLCNLKFLEINQIQNATR